MTTATPQRPIRSAPRDQRPRPGGPQRLSVQIDPFRVLRRYMLAIMASVVVGVGVGVGAFVLAIKFYPMSTGTVLFEIRPGISDPREIGSTDIMQDQVVLRLSMTEALLLTSRDVIDSAMRDQQVRNTTWFQTKFVDEDGTELVDKAVDELVEDLRTGVVRNTNLFKLEWTTHHAPDLPVVLNRIQAAYLDRRATSDKRVYDTNIGVYNAQIDRTRSDMNDKEQKRRRFIREHGLQTLDDPRNSQLAYKMQELAQQITEISGLLSQSQSRLGQTDSKLQGTVEATSDDRVRAEHDPALGLTINRIIEIKTQLREAYEIYEPGHPLLNRLESRLRATEFEKEEKLNEVIHRNLLADLKEAQDQVEQLRAVHDRLQSEYEDSGLALRELAANQAEYQSMTLELEYLHESVNADIELIKEVKLMQLRADASRVKLAQEALEPRELSFPRLEIMIPMGTLIIVSMTVALIFLREFTDQRVKGASDLAVIPGAQVLGVIPDRVEDPTKIKEVERAVQRVPHSVVAESYRQAFASIDKRFDHAGHQTLLLVGGLPGSGTTTAVTNLAASWAAAGRNVAVVDANFRRPRLAEAMGVEANGPGLGDLLAGDSTILEQAILPVCENISIIPAGSPANRVSELLNSRKLDRLLAELRDRFDVVIFDAPPAVIAGEAIVLANKVDASILIVRANQEHRGLVARIINRLVDSNCELLGILLNRPRGTAGGYFKKNFATMAAYTVPQSSE